MPQEQSNNADEADVSLNSTDENLSQGKLIMRSAFGGVLMGLANLVPGISGGTMLLAAGIYPRFIDAIASVTKLRFRWNSLLVLGVVVVAAGLAILLGAGTLKGLVVDHRWIMYSLFIGLTLGGVPVVWKLAKPANGALIFWGLIAFLIMVGLFELKRRGIVGANQSSVAMSLLAGLAGASAMILPGLSGGYILLLLGQYVPVLSAIEQFKDALKAGDMSAAMEPAMSVLLPVGIGVIAGVVIVGNLVQWLLNKYQKATLGFLLGLLLGSTIGLWPFQQGTQPKAGQMIKGQVVTVENMADFDPEDWPTQFFQPKPVQIAGAIGLILLGFGITMGVAKLGGDSMQPTD